MKINKFVAGFVLSSAILVGNISPIYANTITSNNIERNFNDQELSSYIETEMINFIKDNNLNVKIDNLDISLRNDIDLTQYTVEEKEQLLKEDISNLKELITSTDYSLSEEQLKMPRLSYSDGRYTAEVWAGVPAVGWSTVKQDFKATISNGKVTSIDFLGDGYMDGVSWGQYNHIDSWETIYSNGTKVDINIKGGINYTFNLINSNYTATFLEELEVDGNKLVRQW